MCYRQSHISRKIMREDEEIKKWFRRITSLPFVHPDFVVKTFLDLEKNVLEELKRLIKHLKEYYVLGKRNFNEESTWELPRFPPHVSFYKKYS